MNRTYLYALLLLVLWYDHSTRLSAQENYHTTTTAERKAKEYFSVYLDVINQNKYAEALKALEKTTSADPLFLDAFTAMGQVQYELKNYRASVTALQKALELSPTYRATPYIALGKTYFAMHVYDSSAIYYSAFLEQPNIDAHSKQKAEHELANATFALDAYANPVPFEPHRLSDSINSDGLEYFPVLSLDEKTLVFTRRRKFGRAFADEDFYTSQKLPNGEWSKAKPMTGINTENNEGAETLSSDGRELYFTRCLSSFESDRSCDIYYSYYKRDSGKWSKPANIQQPINTNAWESQPSLSPDGNTLYFASNRPGGKGGHDIWISTWDDKKHNWGVPVNAGDSINTAYDEFTPFIAADNNTLYFASAGHPGMGGQDLFYSRKHADGSWGKPINLGYPINTSGDENSLFIARDGHSAYLASDRTNDGNLDIYEFDLYPAARPIVSTYVEGYVTDDLKPLDAAISLIDVKTHKVVMQTESAASDGHYMVSLPVGHDYAMEINKPGYLFFSVNFSIPVSKEETYKVNARLQHIAVGNKLVLKNIFFSTDSYELKPESMPELDVLMNVLKTNSGMHIEIGGHTDNTGDDAHNMQLSDNRAASVVRYLTEHGIDAARLTSKGYGSTKPIDTNATPEGRSNNRRTEFTILAL